MKEIISNIENAIEFQLTKKKNYHLKPFGRFSIKWNASNALNKKPHILSFSNIGFNYDEGMPIEGETDKAVIKFMIKNKTDVLINGRGQYFTRIGIGFTRIIHPKLSDYSFFMNQTKLEDTKETWDLYVQNKL